MRLEKDSFVDASRSHFSDLIYSTTTRFNTDLRLAFLYEHKSYSDDWVDFQVLRYKMGYWVKELSRSTPNRKKQKGNKNALAS